MKLNHKSQIFPITHEETEWSIYLKINTSVAKYQHLPNTMLEGWNLDNNNYYFFAYTQIPSHVYMHQIWTQHGLCVLQTETIVTSELMMYIYNQQCLYGVS